MSTTEIRYLQTSTNLLGAVLHLDDVIGTFAAREVVAMSETRVAELFALATRIAVTAALIFLEFGLLFLYAPILTSALLIGMVFYPVPEHTVTPPPLPIPGPAPRTRQQTEPQSPVRPTTSRIPSQPTTPVSQTGYRTPLCQTPDAQAEERAKRLQRREQLLTESFSSSGVFQTPFADQTQSTLFETPLDSEPGATPMSSSMIVSSQHRLPPVSQLPRSLSSSSLSNLDRTAGDSLLTSSTVTQSPPLSPRLTHPITTQTTSTQPSSLPTVSPVDQLFAIIDQALGHDDDNLSHFFIQHLLPDNITDVEYDSATQRFTIHLSAAREATIPRVGPTAISKVLGSTLNIKRTVTGTLNIQGRSLTFDGDALQLTKTAYMVSTTLTLTGLRRNFSGTISLTGSHWLTAGDLIGTYEQFVDTFSHVTWKSL